MRVQRGFTLIEMLISATLLMIVLGTSMYGYQLYMQYWQREQLNNQSQFQRYRAIDLVYNALTGTVPYAVEQANTYAFYFLGRDNGFTAVTLSSVFNPGSPAVYRLFREQSKDGRFQLVYEEASLAGINLQRAEQQLPFSHRVVLQQDLRRVEFSYLRIENQINEQFPDQLLRTERWLPALDGMVLKAHPVALRVALDSLQIDIVIPERQNLLLQRYQSGDAQT